MSTKKRERADRALAMVDTLISFVPDVAEGPIDEAAIAIARGVIAVTRKLIREGGSEEEILASLEAMAETPETLFSLEEIKLRAKAKLAAKGAE